MESPPSQPLPLEHIERAQSKLNDLADLAAAGVAAGVVSHEVRNLLTPAAAYVQLALRDPKLAPAVRISLERASTAMQRACEVAELVVALSRAEPASSSTTRILPVVRECLELLGWDTQAAPTTHLQIPEELCVDMPADALRHVVLNLLLNAQASMPQHSGQVTIQAVGSTSNISIEVQDNGRGIPPPLLASLQTALQSAAHSHPMPSGGLGLFLCRRLLMAHRGSIALKSTEGVGTTVRLTLPIPNKLRSSLAA